MISMTGGDTIEDRLAALPPEAFKEEGREFLNTLMVALLLQGPFEEGIACAALSPLPNQPAAFPVVTALLNSGQRALAFPSEEFVLAIVEDLDRVQVFAGLPLLEALAEDEWPLPDDEASAPAGPPDDDEPRRISGAWRVDLMKNLSFVPQAGLHRVWLVYYDWRSTACDVKIAGTGPPGLPRAVAPLPSSGKVTYVPTDAPSPPETVGVEAKVDQYYLRATVRAQTRTIHLPPAPTSVVEADGRERDVGAVIPVTLVLASGTGGKPTVVEMGVPLYGPTPQLGAEIEGRLSIDLAAAVPSCEDGDVNPCMLWILVEGQLSGPVKVE